MSAEKPINYDAMSYKALKDELAKRGIALTQENRSKVGIIAELERYDKARAPKPEPTDKPVEDLTPVELMLRERVPRPSIEALQNIIDMAQNRNRVEEGLRVRNLPADYLYAWPSLQFGGEDLSRWTSLGWIRVTTDMVTSDPRDTSKIYVSSYEEHVGGYVRFQDTTLVIAHYRAVNMREAGRAKNWNSRVESMYGDRGKLTEVETSDPAEGGAPGSFRRTAQIAPEDMLQGGDR